MPEPTIPETLRKSLATPLKVPDFRLRWPDDPDAQALGNRLLADMVGNEALTVRWREHAFELLEVIAREDIYGWSLLESAREAARDVSMTILAGKIKHPKRWCWRTDTGLRQTDHPRRRAGVLTHGPGPCPTGMPGG